MEVSIEEFDNFVQLAIESIDPQFRVYLAEVPVIVEEMPGEQICRRMGIAGQNRLLGLFQGVPLKNRVNGIGAPSQISLYRQNILGICRCRKELAQQIGKVIIHELGHYLGFSEQELRRHDY